MKNEIGMGNITKHGFSKCVLNSIVNQFLTLRWLEHSNKVGDKK
jgi:hypothetical protein